MAKALKRGVLSSSDVPAFYAIPPGRRAGIQWERFVFKYHSDRARPPNKGLADATGEGVQWNRMLISEVPEE